MEKLIPLQIVGLLLMVAIFCTASYFIAEAIALDWAYADVSEPELTAWSGQYKAFDSGFNDITSVASVWFLIDDGTEYYHDDFGGMVSSTWLQYARAAGGDNNNIRVYPAEVARVDLMIGLSWVSFFPG